MLKEAKLSGHEFAWRVRIPNIKRYNRIRRQYKSYLSDGQIEADELLLNETVRKTPREGITLDVASGMGTLLLAMSKSKSGGQMLGTDIDETPLRGAMMKLKREGSYHRVSLCVMDGKHLAVKSGAIPFVVSYFGFDNIPDVRQALSETFRILAPKGKLVFATLSVQDESKSFKKAAEHGFADSLSDAGRAAALEDAGFQVDRVERFYSGTWLHNPMDLLPFEGDWFTHSLVQAHKK